MGFDRKELIDESHMLEMMEEKTIVRNVMITS